MVQNPVLMAKLNFLRPSQEYVHEKPYGFRYDIEGIKRTNIDHDEYDQVRIYNMRDHEGEFTLDKNGFEVMHLNSKLEYQSFWDPAKIGIYLHELEDLLKSRLGASHVKVFRHGVSYP